MIVIHEEDQARFLQFDCAIVFHLGDRDIVAVRHIAVAKRKNSNIHVGVINQLQRSLNRVGVKGWQLFHHVRLEASALAALANLIAMVRQIARGAGNHHLAFGDYFRGHCCFNRMNL